MSLKDHFKKHGLKYKIGALFAAGTIAGMGIAKKPAELWNGGFQALRLEAYATETLEERFNNMYEKALFVYADKNNDNVISYKEKSDFDAAFLEDKNAYYTPNRGVTYKDGTKVPINTLTNWIGEYIDNQ